jgi:ATP-binding cassette subfamily C (CFTR/MRP) protein 4
LNFISACFITTVFLVVIWLRKDLGLTAGAIGLLLSYTLQLAGSLQWVVRQSTEVDNMMLSVERVFEFGDLLKEGDPVTEIPVPPEWPESGGILFQDMSLNYGITKVLKTISFEIEPGSKVGIVGRSGAGKSSLIEALFRLTEPKPKASIFIGGLSITEMSPFDLRQRISVIPQEPVCFKGTVRFNLDPFCKYDDQKIWSVLEFVELKELISNMPHQLESQVGTSHIWSTGQKQLLCLARCILKESKIVIMDEATSSIDILTDELFRKAVFSGVFSECTVINIAHRLETLLAYDCIVVLEDGRVVEIVIKFKLLGTSCFFACKGFYST